jgi:hypothetical protein
VSASVLERWRTFKVMCACGEIGHAPVNRGSETGFVTSSSGRHDGAA